MAILGRLGSVKAFFQDCTATCACGLQAEWRPTAALCEDQDATSRSLFSVFLLLLLMRRVC